MKLDTNIETDRLLRRFAERKRDVSSSAENVGDTVQVIDAFSKQGTASHMDADELTAFAENALPAATRVRYAGHLSDCDMCRKVVTNLVLSSGLAGKLEVQTPPQVPVRSWSGWVAAMFAPRVLRYAASVIVLVGVTAIALMVFRGGMSRKIGTSQSQSENSSPKKRTDDTGKTSSRDEGGELANARTPARTDSEGPEVAPTDASPSSTTGSTREAPLVGEKAGTDQPIARPPAPSVAKEDNLYGKQASTRDKDIELAERRQPDLEAAPVEKSKPKKEAARGIATGRIAQDSGARTETDEIASTQDTKVTQSKAPASTAVNSTDRHRARSNAEPAASAGAQASDERKSRADDSREEAKQTVGGKQFVRRDGRWVDIAYRSQATTNVSRGSDQYRALVADEPGLRTIATQLGGEIVVVWKGRAYRIR